MEIRRWLCYVVVNFALVCYIVGKPFSLNKLIESESIQKEVIYTTLSPKIEDSEPVAERFSLNKGLKPLYRITKKYKETGPKLNLISLGKKISPLKYRKTFQIKSPLKPKRVKNSLRTRHKRKNQSIKREADENAILNKKYVPLLRSLGMLFGNILGTDSGESIEKTKHKKRLRYYPVGDDEISCKCPRRGESNAEPESEEETIAFSKALASEVAVTTEAPTETTDNPSAGNIRTLRQHKNVPLLLSRNSSGARRNNYGHSERSRATHNGSAERDISGNNRDSEHNPKRGQEQFYAESNEDDTDSDSRNNASRIRIRGALRGREYGNNSEEVYENVTISQDETENFLESREDTAQYNGSYKLKTERDKAKSGKLLSKPIRRQRGFLSNDKVIESIQSEEIDKKSVISITHGSTGDQGLADGDGPHSSENKKAHAGTETVIGKLPKKTNLYTDKSAKVTEGNGIISDFTVDEQNDVNDEGVANISNNSSELRSLDINDSTEDQKTNTRSETDLLREPVVEKPHGISKQMKDNTILANSTKTIFKEYEEEKYDTDHGNSKQFDIDNTYSTKEEARSAAVHKSPEVDISQYLSKPKKLGPVVMIIDGYSVTRHKNGENKLAEKTIRIRP